MKSSLEWTNCGNGISNGLCISERRPQKTWVTAGGGGCARTWVAVLMRYASTSEGAQTEERKLQTLTWVHVRSLSDPRILSDYVTARTVSK